MRIIYGVWLEMVSSIVVAFPSKWKEQKVSRSTSSIAYSKTWPSKEDECSATVLNFVDAPCNVLSNFYCFTWTQRMKSSCFQRWDLGLSYKTCLKVVILTVCSYRSCFTLIACHGPNTLYESILILLVSFGSFFSGTWGNLTHARRVMQKLCDSTVVVKTSITCITYY